jgi:hypothetical protein
VLEKRNTHLPGSANKFTVDLIGRGRKKKYTPPKAGNEISTCSEKSARLPRQKINYDSVLAVSVYII